MSADRSIVLACALALATTACASGTSGPPYDISSEVLRDGSSQAVRVWAPTSQGSWPVVYALPGISGHKSDYDLLGPALAAQGVVVFATDYRTDGTLEDLAADLACGYQLASRRSDEYGGDLEQPVTGVGYSFGAFWMLAGALTSSDADGAAGSDGCAEDLPLPDVVVGLNGCYFTGQPMRFRAEDLDRREADVLVIASSEDRTCPAEESEEVAADLQAAGFDASLTTIRGANHFAPIFHDFDDGEWVRLPDSSAGDRTVESILDAIEGAS